jgi:hypothetical protein
MKTFGSRSTPVAILGLLLTGALGASAEVRWTSDTPENAAGSATATAGGAVPAATPAAIVLAAPVETPDPCAQAGVAANPTRPAWDYAASTTQCGILETDYGFLSQPLGAGVAQQELVTSLRYGLTPKLDLRWGISNHIWQGGGGSASLQGVGDQWLGARFRFHEQGKVLPAMAFLYAGKIPAANPAKGLGSGYVDHQFLLIASRDVGKNHFDFNTVGTLAGESRGHNGAAQFGLALTRPITPRFSGILESYGGGQPGTSSRFGAGFVGATYTMRPQLVLDGAFTRTYTAGSPRRQVLFGITYARRAGFSSLPRESALARLLGR